MYIHREGFSKQGWIYCNTTIISMVLWKKSPYIFLDIIEQCLSSYLLSPSSFPYSAQRNNKCNEPSTVQLNRRAHNKYYTSKYSFKVTNLFPLCNHVWHLCHFLFHLSLLLSSKLGLLAPPAIFLKSPPR